jgi:hypothetical protein
MQEQDASRFEWHPTYGGRTAREVRAELARALASDQRAHALALEGAEGHESDALASVLEIERKWGAYDFGWAEADPEELAGRIVAFELERERRRELIPFAVYRAESAPISAPDEGAERPWWAFWRR